MRAGQFGIQGQVSTSRAWRCFATRRYKTVVYTVDVVLSLAFLVDFTVRLHLSASTPHSFRDFGRADLLARLPLPQARVLRILRLVGSAAAGPLPGRQYRQASLLKAGCGKCPVDAVGTLLLIGVLVLEIGVSSW